jgi:hypothetical protein
MTQTKENIIVPDIVETKDGKKLPSISAIEKDYDAKIKELKKNKGWLRYVVSGGVILGSLFLASLVAAHIITGALALGIAGIIVALLYFGFKAIKIYDPLIQKKMQNDKIRRLLKEAQEKKIETLTAYVQYLDDYLQKAKTFRNKVDMLIEKYKQKKDSVNDESLKKEYDKLINQLKETRKNIEIVVQKSKEKKEEFVNILKIAREKFNFIEETEDIAKFLSNSSNEMDKIMVNESLNQLEKEFLQISSDIKNLASDIEKEEI